jgi:hypothetical protein
VAVERAQWLADITSALAEARGLLWQLAVTDARDIDALELSERIDAAWAEARSMSIGRHEIGSIWTDPKWSESPLWSHRLERSC